MTEAARALRTLRWLTGFSVAIFGLLPVTMVTLLVLRGNTPGAVGFLLIGGIPLIVLAVIAAIQGMLSAEPEHASRRLHLSMALVAGADVLLLGGNALIRMATGA